MNGNLILTLPLLVLGGISFFAFWKMIRAAQETDKEMSEHDEWDWEGEFYAKRREIETVAEDD